MVQGTLKKTSSNNTNKSSRSKILGPRPGRKVIAPKKQKLVAQQKLTKKATGALIVATERKLASKAGHLELLRGGKKDKEKEGGKEGK